MNIHDDDVIRLWETLNAHGVRYIVVGGFAVNLHSFYRTTADIDLYIEDTPQNRSHLANALGSLGITSKELIQRMQFVPGWTTLELSNGFPIDIMTSLKGLEHLTFDQCLTEASNAEIEGVTIHFLHINHLITAKKATNRPKDQIDVIALEAIRKEMEGH